MTTRVVFPVRKLLIGGRGLPLETALSVPAGELLAGA
jgi:hypothetical protein